MYTTINQDGQLNNYAIETPVYYAEYPNSEQQRRYAFQGACAILFVKRVSLLSFLLHPDVTKPAPTQVSRLPVKSQIRGRSVKGNGSE
ncbi:photosystem II assembly protein Psb34 [Coleofasciculus sp. G2-EDA-02]|uniref:photosystem II assembly protein Psb34 n=1 Tax=Coleofasciculus sp. G2-EDA-02 TaxID=3069529 RepID=UPI00330097A2